MGVLPQHRLKNLQLGQDGNALVMLIALNALLFVIINFIKIAYFLGGLEESAFRSDILQWLQMPPALNRLLLQPWSVVSYMFTHHQVWHMISNMLWLWAFGFILQDLSGNRHLAPIYLYGGWAGAFFFSLTVNAFPVLQQQIPGMSPFEGAGAATLAIAVAATLLSPGYRVFPLLNGGIPLWVLTLVFVLIDFALVASSGGGVAVAHLAGGAAGFWYMKGVMRGKDYGEWMHQLYHWFFNLFEPKNPRGARQAQRERIHYAQGPEPFSAKPKVTQQRVDELLDKISTRGYQYLSDEEKEYLRRASREEI